MYIGCDVYVQLLLLKQDTSRANAIGLTTQYVWRFQQHIENSILLLMFRLVFESFHSSGQAYYIRLRAVDWSASTLSFQWRKYDIVLIALIAEPRWR